MRTAAPILLLATLILVPSCGDWSPAVPVSRSPSILLVTVDTLRADHTGPGGYDLGTTPALDALARRGTVFERCLAAQPETGPSIASVMTGRHPREIGVRENGDVLSSDFIPLAETLGELDYTTAAFVSTYLLKPHACGLDLGFQTYDHEMTSSNLGHEGFERPAAETAARATAWIRAQSDGPFFLWVHLYDPHGLYDPGQEVAATFQRKSGRPPLDPAKLVSYQRFGDSLDPDDYVARYDGEVFLADQAIGLLVEAMPAGSIIAVHADHGEGLGEHDYWFRHGSRLDRAALHVPLVIAGPGVPEGHRVSSLALNLDIAAALVALASRSFDGLSPLTDRESSIAFAEARRGGGVRDDTGIDTRYKVAATTETHRLVLWPETGESLLFDLAADPLESIDVAAEYPEIVDRLGTAIRRWLATSDRMSGDEVLPDIDRALRGLGYIEGGGGGGD